MQSSHRLCQAVRRLPTIATLRRPTQWIPSVIVCKTSSVISRDVCSRSALLSSELMNSVGVIPSRFLDRCYSTKQTSDSESSSSASESTSSSDDDSEVDGSSDIKTNSDIITSSSVVPIKGQNKEEIETELKLLLKQLKDGTAGQFGAIPLEDWDAIVSEIQCFPKSCIEGWVDATQIDINTDTVIIDAPLPDVNYLLGNANASENETKSRPIAIPLSACEWEELDFFLPGPALLSTNHPGSGKIVLTVSMKKLNLDHTMLLYVAKLCGKNYNQKNSKLRIVGRNSVKALENKVAAVNILAKILNAAFVMKQELGDVKQ